MAAVLNLIPIGLALTLAALGMGAAGLVTLREAYEAIDWPVLVLLGAMLPVAIGASSAFLTPIGHQSNVLVMGPGGYRFGDYWRVGLPLEVLIVAVAAPAIVVAWG